ncbi:MAG: sulfite exporter TauE/SafE family protein [Longimicrobiales bacterium]
MDDLFPLALAFALGTAHALEADHLAAVSAFVVSRPGARAALAFGTRWSIGHGGAVLAVGTMLIALRVSLPTDASRFLETLAGAALVLLGLWTLFGARRLRARRHRHSDGTLHAHLHGDQRHTHAHAVTGVGALHGLAGTAPAVALLPLTHAESALLGGGYLLFFAIGTALAMGLYALSAGWIADRVAVRSDRFARGLVLLTGLAATAVGLAWILP